MIKISAMKFLKIEKKRSMNYPGGVLGISSDGDDRRIFLGLKFSIPGFFVGRKICQVFFLGSLI